MPKRLFRKPRVLVLGGSFEAHVLIETLTREGFQVVASIGPERECYDAAIADEARGGFAGAEGLMTALKWRRFDAVIDACPPFDGETANAAHVACAALGAPLLRLRRPAWSLDAWPNIRRVDDAGHAAKEAQIFSRVFLDVGRRDIIAFQQRRDTWFLARLHTPVRGRFPLPRGDFAVGKPPFTCAHEVTLLRDYRIRQLVLRDEGGEFGRSSLDAAAELDLPVILINRPGVPNGPIATTPQEAVDWVRRRV
ncbi:MAG: precorrin-6A/cobalt-precorrin-6A reductase [Pseudomonadota bacterium]